MKRVLLLTAVLTAGLAFGGAAEAQTAYPMQPAPAGPTSAVRELLNQSMIAQPGSGAAATPNAECRPPAIAPAAGWSTLPASNQPC